MFTHETQINCDMLHNFAESLNVRQNTAASMSHQPASTDHEHLDHQRMNKQMTEPHVQMSGADEVSKCAKLVAQMTAMNAVLPTQHPHPSKCNEKPPCAPY